MGGFESLDQRYGFGGTTSRFPFFERDAGARGAFRPEAAWTARSGATAEAEAATGGGSGSTGAAAVATGTGSAAGGAADTLGGLG